MFITQYFFPSIHSKGFDVLPDVRNIRGNVRNAPVRLQHRRYKCSRQEYRKLHEGRVSRSIRRRCQRGIYQTITIGGCVDFRHWRNVWRVQWWLDGKSLWTVKYTYTYMIRGRIKVKLNSWFKISSKGGLLLNNVLGIAGACLMGFTKVSHSYEMLFLGRFIIGLNCGKHTIY